MKRPLLLPSVTPNLLGAFFAPMFMPFLLPLFLALVLTSSLCAESTGGVDGKTKEQTNEQTTVRADAAKSSLLSGHPIDALAGYSQLVESPQFALSGSPELWYNKGLAEEKTGDSAAASLSFRRALLLDPGLVPAQRQLAKVLEALGLPMASSKWGKLFTMLSPETIILGGAIVGWIGVFLLIVLLVRGPRRRSYLVAATLALLLGHGLSLGGSLLDPRRSAAHKAVVTAKKAPSLRATPADSATPNGALAAGTLITILSQNGAWWYVSAGSGAAEVKGWIPSQAATPLLPAACTLPPQR